MELDQILLMALLALSIPNWLVVAILMRAAWKRPRIMFLTMSAISSFLVALGIGAYCAAVLNAQADYIFPAEPMRIILRLILFGIALFPFWWLWLYLTGRFR